MKVLFPFHADAHSVAANGYSQKMCKHNWEKWASTALTHSQWESSETERVWVNVSKIPSPPECLHIDGHVHAKLLCVRAWRPIERVVINPEGKLLCAEAWCKCVSVFFNHKRTPRQQSSKTGLTSQKNSILRHFNAADAILLRLFFFTQPRLTLKNEGWASDYRWIPTPAMHCLDMMPWLHHIKNY